MSFLSDLDRFCNHVKMNTTPLARSLDDRVDAVLELISIVEKSANFVAALDEALRIVSDCFLRTNKDNIVDDAVGNCALAIFEIDEYFGDRLGDLNRLTLSHCKTIKAVVVATASEAEEFTNARAVTKLVVPGHEVKLNEVSTFVDEVADAALGNELHLAKRFFSKKIVDVDSVLDRTFSLLEVFDDGEHLAEPFH